MFFLGVKVARSTVKEVTHFTGGSSVIDPRWWRPLLESVGGLELERGGPSSSGAGRRVVISEGTVLNLYS